MADSAVSAAATPSKAGDRTSKSEPSSATTPPGANRYHLTPSSASSATFSTLPPLVTAIGARRTSAARAPSWASRRVSTFSTTSGVRASRPQSVVFPVFHSSLPYALVRDFAYAHDDALHYGAPPEAASAPSSTTASEFPRRLSDPQLIIPHIAAPRTPWSGHPDSLEASKYSGPRLPAMTFGDGPPWREDEDLLSPIVTTARHRKTRSDLDYFSSRSGEVNASSGSGRRTSYAGTNQDGSQTYYIDHKEEQLPGGPGGEFVTLPGEADYQFGGGLHGKTFAKPYDESPSGSPRHLDPDDNRFSRDYSFSIASPDEEMHGKAIALFDFESENDNELPLIEGQVLWISYRHGQGWLVAKDPATGEDGLVPEAYVRLEREIQGGFGQLNVQVPHDESPSAPETPTASSIHTGFRGSDSHRQSNQQYPVVSHFTTSSKDLLPQHARGPHGHTTSSGSMEQQMGSLHVHSEEEDSSPSSADGEDTEKLARRPSATKGASVR